MIAAIQQTVAEFLALPTVSKISFAVWLIMGYTIPYMEARAWLRDRHRDRDREGRMGL